MTPEVVAHLGAVAISFLFVLAASYKVNHDTQLADTLKTLGLPSRFAVVLASWLWILEALFAAIIVVAGNGPSAAALVVVGFGLVAVGFRATRLDKPVRCFCFGSEKSSHLGLRQIALGGCIAGLGFLVWTLAPTGQDFVQSILRFSLITVAACLARFVSAYPLLREQMTLRQLFQSEYPA